MGNNVRIPQCTSASDFAEVIESLFEIKGLKVDLFLFPTVGGVCIKFNPGRGFVVQLSCSSECVANDRSQLLPPEPDWACSRRF
jgi:hypothetical protein